MNKTLKPFPAFADEAEERHFWESNDSTDYLDWDKACPISSPRQRFRSAGIRAPSAGSATRHRLPTTRQTVA
jgi:hypothetical protein